MIQQIAASEFRVKCLRLLDEVNLRRCEYIITKRGQPVARLVPADAQAPSVFGHMRGTGEIVGDIVTPVGEPWEADR